MSGYTAFAPIGALNNVVYTQMGKVFKNAGKGGLASFILGSNTNVPKYVSTNIGHRVVAANINITSGVLLRRSNELSEDKKELNKIVLNVVKPSSYEYDNTQRVVSVLLNGTTLEGENPMVDNKELSFGNEAFVVGTLDFIGQIPVKARNDATEVNLIKQKHIGFDDFNTIKGNVEFIGKIPKKPRI